MALNDLFRVTLYQDYFGQKVQNVWHYRQAGSLTTPGAANLATTFQASVLTPIADCQVNELLYERLLVQNLMTPADNAEDLSLTEVTGNIVSTGAPSLIAMSFRSDRPDLSKRFSYKRLAAPPIGQITGQIFTSGQVTIMQACANAMELVLSTAAGFNFTPCQVRRVIPGIGDPFFQWVYDIIVWTPSAQVTTQDTRKIGRGD